MNKTRNVASICAKMFVWNADFPEGFIVPAIPLDVRHKRTTRGLFNQDFYDQHYKPCWTWSVHDYNPYLHALLETIIRSHIMALRINYYNSYFADVFARFLTRFATNHYNLWWTRFASAAHAVSAETSKRWGHAGSQGISHFCVSH